MGKSACASSLYRSQNGSGHERDCGEDGRGAGGGKGSVEP
jgi:hypothetical protein